MLAGALGLEAGVYGLGLVEKLSESLGKTGNAVERFGDFVDDSNTELSLVFCEIFFRPVQQLSLSPAAAQESSVATVGLYAFLQGLGSILKETTESITEFIGNCLQTRELLQFLREIASAEGVKDCLRGGVDGCLEDLLDFHQGQTMPLIPGNVIQDGIEDIRSIQLLADRLPSQGQDIKQRLQVLEPLHGQLLLPTLKRLRFPFPQGQFLLYLLVERCDDKGSFFNISGYLLAYGNNQRLLLIQVILTPSYFTLSMSAQTSLKSADENLPIYLCFCVQSRTTAYPSTQPALARIYSSYFDSLYTRTMSSNNRTLSLICIFSNASSTIMILSRNSATDCDSKNLSILSGLALKMASMTLEGLAGMRLRRMRITYPLMTQLGVVSKYLNKRLSNGWLWSSGSSRKNSSQTLGIIVERRSAAIMGTLKERVLSLGGPGMMSRFMISIVFYAVSMERKAGLLVFSQSTATSYCTAQEIASLRCQRRFYSLEIRSLSSIIIIFKQGWQQNLQVLKMRSKLQIKM